MQVLIFHAPWRWLVCELYDLHCVLHLQPGFFCGSCAALQIACQKIIACRLLPMLCCVFGPVPAFVISSAAGMACGPLLALPLSLEPAEAHMPCLSQGHVLTLCTPLNFSFTVLCTLEIRQ